jgi:hypothetical protein
LYSMNSTFGIEPNHTALRNPFGVEVVGEDLFPRVAAARQPWAVLFQALRAISDGLHVPTPD